MDDWLNEIPKTDVSMVIKAGVSEKGSFARNSCTGFWNERPVSPRIGIILICHRPLVGDHFQLSFGCCM